MPAAATKAVEPKTVPAETAVITIHGVCGRMQSDKSADCETVFTRAQFEALLGLVQPNLPEDGRKKFAMNYADTIIRAAKAEQMGLDKGTRFEQLMALQRQGVLSQLLIKTLDEKAGQIADKDIEDYYKQNGNIFEELELQTLYVPVARLLGNTKDTPVEAQKHQQDSIADMKKVADDLRGRAVAGEDFAKLQADAYRAAGYSTTVERTETTKTHRGNLRASQLSVWDLKPGEISQVLDEANGHYIYKAGKKDMPPLEQVRAQIFKTLRNQRLQQYWREIQQSATATFSQEYFENAPSPNP